MFLSLYHNDYLRIFNVSIFLQLIVLIAFFHYSLLKERQSKNILFYYCKIVCRSLNIFVRNCYSSERHVFRVSEIIQMNVEGVGLPPPHQDHHTPAERVGRMVPHIQLILEAHPTLDLEEGATLQAQVQLML